MCMLATTEGMYDNFHLGRIVCKAEISSQWVSKETMQNFWI